MINQIKAENFKLSFWKEEKNQTDLDSPHLEYSQAPFLLFFLYSKCFLKNLRYSC